MEVEAERTDTASLDGLMKEPGEWMPKVLRAEATMRVLIMICLVLDFALVCLFVAVAW